MALEAGTQVTPRVKLVRPLGEGGMGSVWVGEHTTLDTEVAVKFVSAALDSADPSTLTRFRREASVAAKLKSPHVVKTFDHGVMDDETPYIVMELLDGESLGARLQRAGTLTLAQLALLLGQVAQVLDEAHERGVVHRDIKPDNLFLVESRYELFVKVLDFGIAKQTQGPVMDGATSTGTLVGTPEYMSPERLLSNEPADASADRWALAVVAYQALTGRLPFHGETVTSLCISICRAAFPPPNEVRSDLPAELDAWFAQALHLEPTERFGSAFELAEAFIELVEDLGVDISSAPARGAKRGAGGSGSGPRILPLKADSSSNGALASADATRGTPVRVTPPDGYAVDDLDPTADTLIAASGGESEAPKRTAGPKADTAAARPATFSGAAATFDPEEQELHRWSVAKVAAIAAAGLLLAGGANLLLRSAGDDRSAGDGGDADSTSIDAVHAGGRSATATAPNPQQPEEPLAASGAGGSTESGERGEPATTSTGAPDTVAPRPVPGGKPPPRPAKPKPKPSAPPSRSGCEQPFYFDSEGIEHIKPECLR